MSRHAHIGAISCMAGISATAEARYTCRMVSLPLDVALSVLTLAAMLSAVQLVIVTMEIVRVRRDLNVLLRTTSALNNAVNPWAGEDEVTEPGFYVPPRFKRKRHIASWFTQLARKKQKRQHPPD